MPVFYDETNPKNFQVDVIFTTGDPQIIMLLVFAKFLLYFTSNENIFSIERWRVKFSTKSHREIFWIYLKFQEELCSK
jgi:hypothetical protein